MEEFETEGLWAHLSERCPPVEKEEIANLIGRGIIKENSALWRELKAFSSILTEINTLEFDRPLTANANQSTIDEQWAEVSLTTENLSQSKIQKNEGVPIPSLHINMAKRANMNNEDFQSDQQLTRRSRTSVDSLDFIMSIEDKICVAKVSDVLDTLRKAFREEKEELEAEIAILYSAMDSETDAIAAEKAAALIQDRQHEKSNGVLINSRAPKMNRFSPQGKRASTREDGREGVQDECPHCQRLQREHAPGRIRPKKEKSREEVGPSMCARCEGRGLEEAYTERLDKGRSKVRSKLQAAKDEKHFLDLDI